MQPKLCIYHANCADGFTAAWVVSKALVGAVEFCPGVYQQVPPDVTGRDVILVDFSYKRAVIEEMLRVAKSVTILDHHKSAIEDLAGLEGLITVFDNERSGAMIAWDYFFPNLEAPALIKHVQDRDLWQFKIDGTREIQAAVFSYDYTFKNWDMLVDMDPLKLREEGAALERKHFKDINELLKITTRRMSIGGYNIPVANLPYTMSSDAGHIMAKEEPFAACYYDSPNGRNFSLRSADNVDVSEIAKLYGGGGHKNAAGFKVPYNIAATFEVSTHDYEI